MGGGQRLRHHSAIAKVPLDLVRVRRARIAERAVELHDVAFIRQLVTAHQYHWRHIGHVHRQRVAVFSAIVVPHGQGHHIRPIVRVLVRRA